MELKLLKNIKNEKLKACFRNITTMEYILTFMPFLLYMWIFMLFIPFYITVIMMFVLGILFFSGIRWRIIYFGIMLFVSLVLITMLGIPWVQSTAADRDEAIRVGIEAILMGKNPFKATTSLGHNPTPLPFTYFFYMPIYFITGGYTFFMSLVIMAIFCFVLFYKFVDSKQDRLVLPVISFITFSEFFVIEAMMQSDLINVGLILCMILLLIPDKISEHRRFQNRILKGLSIFPEDSKKIDKKSLIFAILFGCLLAMRIHIWVIGPLIALYLLKIYGLKNTCYLLIVSIGIFLAWMLPFVLQDVNYFIYVNPIAHNSQKFYIWRKFQEGNPTLYYISTFLNTYLNYGVYNGIIVSCIIVIISSFLGLIKCKNMFHLLWIIAFSYLIFIFFYIFGIYYLITQDYLSIPTIPFIFSFLYVDLNDSNSSKINHTFV